MNPLKAVRGTRDILPPDSAVWNRVEAIAREVFRVFNYQEIRTPIFEETALFARGVGEDTDIVGKEMYTWEDRDGSSLTLRPENTASVMRAYIEHRLDQVPGVKKLYYIGPMFRRERPQKGRYRQFVQCDIDIIGDSTELAEVELLTASLSALAAIGLADATIRVNHRALLTANIASLGVAADQATSAMITIDKLDKVGISGVTAELAEKFGSTVADAAGKWLESIAGALAVPTELASEIGRAHV